MLGKQFNFCLLSLYDGVCLAHLSYYSAMASLVYFYGFNEELAYFCLSLWLSDRASRHGILGLIDLSWGPSKFLFVAPCRVLSLHGFISSAAQRHSQGLLHLHKCIRVLLPDEFLLPHVRHWHGCVACVCWTQRWTTYRGNSQFSLENSVEIVHTNVSV